MSLPLALERVRKSHGATAVFAELDLRVAAGEVVALLGPSGSGKSTLVRLVAGLDRADGGSVRVGDVPVDGPSARVGLMFQEPRLLPWLDAAANVAFGLGDPGGERTGTRARVAALLASVGLPDAGNLLPSQLSGGMAQRVALARALARDPDVLLLDEPFGAVDALTRATLQRLLLDVTRPAGTTVVLVTHDVEEALRVADRLVVLAGRPARVVLDARVPGVAPRAPDADGLHGLRARALGALGVEPSGAPSSAAAH